MVTLKVATKFSIIFEQSLRLLCIVKISFPNLYVNVRIQHSIVSVSFSDKRGFIEYEGTEMCLQTNFRTNSINESTSVTSKTSGGI